MNPSGDVAIQQRNLILVSTGLMLIIVPVIARCCLHGATARPTPRLTTARTGTITTQLELVIWAAPLLIITRAGRDHPAPTSWTRTAHQPH
jgi:cytochrome o ubiquinol oxidase subunit 2